MEEGRLDTFDRGSPEYVSVGFVARRCGVSNTTVLRWIGSGRLPAFRLPGGHYRVAKNDYSCLLTRPDASRGTKQM
jgi:excisionase family DNA binding protein